MIINNKQEMTMKSMADRTKESINLIKQIRDLGIAETDPTYLEIKTHLNNWIKSEDKHIQEIDLVFHRYGRKARLTLPWRSDKFCEFLLKKPRG